jgi:arginine decarboxylase
MSEPPYAPSQKRTKVGGRPDWASGIYFPRGYFLVSARGEGSSELGAFDRALLSVGIGNVNIIRLSSILPPGIPNRRPKAIVTGCFVGAAYAHITSGISDERIGAAVAIAHPCAKTRESVIMEHAGLCSALDAQKKATQMAIEALEARDLKIKNVEHACVEHVVHRFIGCVFAAVVQV